jgi:ribonuclease P protein component
VYDGRRCERTGPLVVYARPNGTDQVRLGLSVGRRVGGAAVRNRVKRLLREAFRHARAALPAGYDVVINVRAHEPLAVDEYGRRLAEAMRSLDGRWRKRSAER